MVTTSFIPDMARDSSVHEPELSPSARRIVGAVLLSIGLHAAILGLLGVSTSYSKSVSFPQLLQVRIQSVPTVVRQTKLNPLEPSRVTPLPAMAELPPSPKPVEVLPASTVRASGEHKALSVMDVAPLVDTTYYTARELDVLPQPIHPVMPNFPERAKLAGLTGWVVLTLKLDDTGAVQSVVMKDSNPSDVFDQSALLAFQHAHFSPGIKAGRPVYSELEIKVHFGDQQ